MKADVRIKFSRIGRFIVTGGAAATVEFLLFLLLHALLGNKGNFVSQTVSFLAGFAVSFSFNKFWVFKSDGKATGELVKYAALAAINLVLTNLVLHLLVDIIGVVPWLAKIIVMAMVATWNYFIFQKLIFRGRTETAPKA